MLFTGGREGYFYALDAKTGKELWKANLGGSIVMAPITYQIDGKQYVSVISGHTLVTFALRKFNAVGVTMGHWHLASKDVEANKKIFLAMGGKLYMPGGNPLIMFPGLYINLILGTGKEKAAPRVRW